jgi:hypothetical protein
MNENKCIEMRKFLSEKFCCLGREEEGKGEGEKKKKKKKKTKTYSFMLI